MRLPFRHARAICWVCANGAPRKARRGRAGAVAPARAGR